MEKLQIEVDKCKLLCANCHREIHNPSLEKENVPHLLDEYDEELVRPEKISNTKTSVCPVCGKEFPKVCGKIFCSKECNYKSKGYPEINEIMEQYSILKNWEKVASYFGISRKTIQRIRKKNGLL